MVEKTTGTRRDQRGETLVELLVTMTILGTTVVALVGGIGTSVLMSDIHRKQATAGAVSRTYAEAIESGVKTGVADPYVVCAPTSAYATPTGFVTPTGYTAGVGSVMYWSLADKRFVSTCTVDSGVQRLTVLVRSTDARAKETLDLVVRQPCLLPTACA